MTPLERRLQEMIRTEGPLSVATYMTACLLDPREGYYATRPALGRDFTTAPETSQIFGEMLGAWLCWEWGVIGRPDPVHLVELGPGRGVMLADAARVIARAPDFTTALRGHLVEASPALRREQAGRLASLSFVHADALEDVPAGPTLLVANEFLDCLPVRQLARVDGGWREIEIGLSPSGAFEPGLGPPAAPPRDVEPAPGQDEIEFASALPTLVERVAHRLLAHPGRALFIDYGPTDAAPRFTLRAYREGRQTSPFSEPGAQDLTADVDFARVRRLAAAAGLEVSGPLPQRDLLLALGAGARAAALARAHPQRADAVMNGLRRLTAADEMGVRFKAVCLSSPGLPAPAGF